MSNNIILKPYNLLLNSNFEGYKLYSDSHENVSSRAIEYGICTWKTSEPPCYLYSRLQYLHNHLFPDPYEINNTYVFNSKGHLLMFSFNEGYLNYSGVVWQDDLQLKGSSEKENQFFFPPTLSFSSTCLAVMTNGKGILNILLTSDRSCRETWINVFEAKIVDGMILDSVSLSEQQEIHVLILSITTPDEIKSDSGNFINEQLLNTKVSFIHIVYWYTFINDGSKWSLKGERRIAGFNSLEYIALEQSANGLVCLSHDDYFFIYDSLEPIQPTKKKESGKELSKFIFSQNNDEINVVFKIGPDADKKDITIDITDRTLKITVKGNIVMDNNLLHSVDSSVSTWEFENEKLDIHLSKTEEGLSWKSLFIDGNDGGEEILDASLVEEVHQRLAHLTSDQWNPPCEPEGSVFNPGKLEDCDDATENLIISVLDGNSHSLTHVAHLGAVQHLFNSQHKKDTVPSFCLRHDVDGLLWSIKEDRTFEHICTFQAFGFVKASKTMAKFTQASTDNSYVAVCDVNSRVYVFCQPGDLGSELKNRKTGKITTTVARQLIISLKNHDQVMGFYCTSSTIFVLTSTDLFAYEVRS